MRSKMMSALKCFFRCLKGYAEVLQARSAAETKDIINQIGSSIIGIATMEIKEGQIRPGIEDALKRLDKPTRETRNAYGNRFAPQAQHGRVEVVCVLLEHDANVGVTAEDDDGEIASQGCVGDGARRHFDFAVRTSCRVRTCCSVTVWMPTRYLYKEISPLVL
ncbi:hypothetical protein DFH94DRAFT_677937 [Russula ochroleuca]|uniref:Uncharacterized protein n=1 Tax=Russula ochroleuca TaxID=152965 RepID=A0A9P5N518_9AGAM|nr:hypothetical protein DFH94DRAFT_677937 [Russula ochroleuca]